MGEAAEQIEQTTQPVHTERVGKVKALVWANPGRYGPMYKTQLVQVYTVEENGKELEKKTSSIDEAQLPNAERALMLVHLALRREKQRQKEE